MGYGPTTAAATSGMAYSSGSNQQDPIEKAVSIHALLDAQAKVVGEAHAIVSELETRLQSILTPLPSDRDANNAPPTPQPMQISARLSDHTRGIHALCSRVNSLMQQLEL